MKIASTFLKKSLLVLKITSLATLLLFTFSGCSDAASTVLSDDGDYNTSITWENWYLSVPVDDGDGATSIYYEDIQNNNLTTEEAVYFYPNNDADSSYTMYTKYTTYTTSGEIDYGTSGKYCRTELREYYQGIQSTDDNWSMDSGTHLMESTLKVESISSNVKGAYVAQIHGISDTYTKENTSHTGSPATVKVLYEGSNGTLGNLKLEYYTAPSSPLTTEWTSDNVTKIDLGYVGNSIFTIKLKVDNGKLYYGLTCGAYDIDQDYTLLYDYASNDYDYRNYFKTGNYFGYNEDSSKSSQVVLCGVTTSHN